MIEWNYLKGQPSEPFGAFSHVVTLGTYAPGSTTELPMAGAGHKVVFTGAFQETAGEVTGGTVTGFRVYEGAELVLQASGYAIDILALVDAIAGLKSDDDGPFFQLIFGQPMTVKGSAGNDVAIFGGAAGDVIRGGAGNDKLFGDISDLIGGNDQLFGGAGDDLLFDYLGDNLFDGGPGADHMEGGAGNDTYIVDNAGDKVIEYANLGVDTVRSFIDYTLPDHVENLELIGTVAINGTGNALANIITGNKAANRIDGGADDDVISGGKGKDALTGGAGADQFVFDVKAKKKNADKIIDFSVGEDTIVLDNGVFKALKGKVLKSGDYFHVGKKAEGKKDFVIYHENKGKLLYDADGKGDGKAKLIAKLDAGLDLSAADILVI